MIGSSAHARVRPHKGPVPADRGRARPVRGLIAVIAAGCAAAPLLALPAVQAPAARAWTRSSVNGITSSTPITALLLSREVGWTTDPGATVEFQLLDGEAVLASTVAHARADGAVTATLPSHIDSIIRPGRVVTARNLGAVTIVSATVPNLVVALDEPRWRVVGTGSPSRPLTVRLVTRDLVNLSAAATDETGAFVIDLPDRVVGDDSLRGDVALAEGEGVFTAAFEEMTALVDIGGTSIRGRATRGSRVNASVNAGADRATSNEFVIEGSAAFTLTVASNGVPRTISTGDEVIVREDGAQRMRMVTPRLGIAAAPSGVFSGTAVPGSIVDVAVSGPEGNGYAAVEADLAGQFRADLSEQVLSLPGSVATATTKGRLAFRAAHVAKGVVARLYASWVTGQVDPGAPVRFTLLDANQSLVASSAATAQSDGSFRAQFLDRLDRPAKLEPGETLLVSIGGSLTNRAELPSILVYGSAADEAVVGTAPVGRPIAVSAGSAMRRTVVDGVGIVVTDFTGAEGPRADIVPGQVGFVTVDDNGPNVVVRAAWVAPLVELDLGGAGARGVGAPGRPVTLALGAGGFPAAEALVEADEMTGSYASTLRDALGAPVPVLSGDELVLELPGWDLTAAVPELSGSGNFVTDRVAGRAPPGETVFVSIPGAGHVAVSSDAAGRFTAASPANTDVRPGDSFRLEMLVRDVVTTSVSGDFHRVVVELDAGYLEGDTAPSTAVSATLYRAGLNIANAATQADASGAYTLALAARAGEWVGAAVGDQLVVDDGALSLNLPIPALSLTLNPAAPPMAGRAPAGSSVSVTLGSPWELVTGRPAGTSATADATGLFTATLPMGRELAAGSTGSVRLAVEPGVSVVRRAAVPYLDMQRGGNLVRGVAASGRLVLVQARRAAAVLADAQGRADVSGVFSVTLSSDSGYRIQPGDEVALQGSVSAIARSVALGLTAPDRRASGLASANALVDLIVERDGARWGPLRLAADERGAFGAILPGDGPLTPGTLVEAGVATDSGHRTFALDAAPLVVVRIGSAELRGRDTPFAEINVQLAAVANGRTRVSTDGTWKCTLEGAVGPVPAIAGERLRVTGAGGREISFDVPELEVSVDEWGHVRGRAPAREFVSVRLAGPGPSFEVVVRAGGDGAWSVDQGVLLGKPPFPLGQTSAALAWITTAAGHRVEAFGYRIVPTPTLAATPTGTGTLQPTPIRSATTTPSATTITPLPTSTALGTPTRLPTATPTATPGPFYALLPIVRSRK